MKCEVCGKEIEKSSYCEDIVCSSECFTKKYWLDRVNNKDSKTQVVINGFMYQIGEENSSVYSRGFDGARFEIEFFDGRKIITTNLWSNGPIPDEFKEMLPDNAKWIEPEEQDDENNSRTKSN